MLSEAYLGESGFCITRYHKGASEAAVVLWHQSQQGLRTVEKCDEGGAQSVSVSRADSVRALQKAQTVGEFA